MDRFEGVRVEQRGDKLIVSADDAHAFDRAVSALLADGAELEFVGTVRGRSRYTAVLWTSRATTGAQ